jgi:hypothetical protein
MLILKINFKKYYFNTFIKKKYFKKQPPSKQQTQPKLKR